MRNQIRYTNIPMKIPTSGVFRHLSDDEKKVLARQLERYAASLIAASHLALGEPKDFVTDTISYVADRKEKTSTQEGQLQFRGFPQLISYCRRRIHSLVNDAIDKATDTQELTDEVVNGSYKYYTSDPEYSSSVDFPKNPEELLLEAERRKLGEIERREESIMELNRAIQEILSPEELVAFEQMLAASQLTDIYNQYKDGKRRGRLDLSPSKVAKATGIPLDTLNKRKHTLKTIADSLGAFGDHVPYRED